MTFDFAQKLLDPDGELDSDALESYAQELCVEFINAPEGEPFDGRWVELLVDYGANYPGVTPATMTPAALEEIVFSIFPRKVSCEPSDAPSILAELRAFFRFVGREFGFRRTAECVRVLDGKAEDQLRRALGNPGNFGMAKSFCAQGERLGFDLSTEKGLQDWVAAHNAGLELARDPAALERVVTAPGFAENFKRKRKRLDEQRAELRARRKQQKAARKRSR